MPVLLHSQRDRTKPPALLAPNGVMQGIRGFCMAGNATCDSGRSTAQTLMIQAQWDENAPLCISQALFPLLMAAPWKRYVLIGEGTHTVLVEKNRMQLFDAVQNLLEGLVPR